MTAFKNVTGIDAFKVVSLPATKQRVFNNNIQNLPILLRVRIFSSLVKTA